MISNFIVVHCTLTTNFSSKLKSQFQVMSVFQASLSQNSMTRLLGNGCWNTCFYHYCFFRKRFPISSCKCLVYRKIFLFCQRDSLVGLPDYSFLTTKSGDFFICLQMVAFEYFHYDLILVIFK